MIYVLLHFSTFFGVHLFDGFDNFSMLSVTIKCAISMLAVIGIDSLSLLLSVYEAKGFACVQFRSLGSSSMDPIQVDQLRQLRVAVETIVLLIVCSAWEEMFFRGYLIGAMGDCLNNAFVAIILSSLLFASQHLRFGYLFAFGTCLYGVLFSCVYLLSGSLLVAIIAHIAGNIYAVYCRAPISERIYLAQMPRVF
jgi:membrane protease YdiL (CAAX protease family)